MDIVGKLIILCVDMGRHGQLWSFINETIDDYILSLCHEENNGLTVFHYMVAHLTTWDQYFHGGK